MQKTFCDKCGAECVNYTARFSGIITHTTSQREEVGEDYLGQKELCKDCTEALAAAFGFMIRSRDDMLREKERRAVAMEQDRPARQYEG
jgi:hypothetical protein